MLNSLLSKLIIRLFPVSAIMVLDQLLLPWTQQD